MRQRQTDNLCVGVFCFGLMCVQIYHKWLFVLQMENYIFTNTHIFVKTNTQVTNRKFVFVDSKTRVQLEAYLSITLHLQLFLRGI